MKKSTLADSKRNTSNSENRVALSGLNSRDQSQQILGLPSAEPGSREASQDVSGLRKSEPNVNLNYMQSKPALSNKNSSNMGRNPNLSTVQDQSRDSFFNNFD